MTDLSKKVELYLGRKFDKFKEIIVQNDSDGKGSYIAEWNAVDKPQPTKEQLNSFESQANDIEALNQVYTNRKSEYPTIKELVVALYDSDDKTAIDEKRAAVKLKYPKP